MGPTPETWQAKVAKKQAEIKAAIPPEWLLPATTAPSTNVLGIPRQCGLLSEKELDITESYDAVELLEKLSSGIFTSAEVTEAFCKRAAIAQQLTSCLTETMYPQAKERAKFLDEYLAREHKVFGPLHGLPISIKDSFNVKGVQSTIGYISFLDRELPQRNSVMVDTLLSLGAVLYVKTNIPQTLMTGDSENNIFGRTLNPHNTTLTAGGSSGGEGALVAFRGSILGVATDIAGSIRIPSLCCGTYGFKPTSGRIPFGGQTGPTLPGMPGITPCAGPIAASFASLGLFLSTIINSKPWLQDSTTHAVPWRPTTDLSKKSKLTIGVLADDPAFPLHPPVRRAIKNAVEKLEAAGHKVVHLKYSEPTSTNLGQRFAMESFSIDPAATSIGHLDASGEPWIKSLVMTLSGPPPKKYGLLEWAALSRERSAYQEAWREHFLTEGLDVVIGPGAQYTAVPHDNFGSPPFTVMWNWLDYPACIIPYGKASKELDPEPLVIEQGDGPPVANYDPALVDGAPCAIQVAAPRFQDEECLYAAKVIDDVLNGTLI
ncbi:general amidase GmdB [Tricladium varicosporioides]|nr:general amidase GmdB [Hymenoscyphus varicosporioides]